MFLQDRGPKGPTSISSSLETIAARLGLARADTFATLESHWTQLIGADLARTCRVVAVRDGVLRVEVTDPAVADHIKWMRGDLVAAANEICGAQMVTEVAISIKRA